MSHSNLLLILLCSIDGFSAPAQVPNTKSQSIMAPGRARSNVEMTWQQEQAQGVLQRAQGSCARRNDPEKVDQGGQSARAQTLLGVQTKEQHKPFAEKKGAIERREEQPLKKAEEDKRKEQESKTREADERKEKGRG